MVIYAADGEKWACEACLKGHRVTSCSHKDRQLFHVNKKGRPVSQCQHCRGLRKSRHSHVKCVCAEYGIDKESAPDRPFGGRRCNCDQGMPCTCASKREIDFDTLPKTAARNLTHRRVQSHGAKPVMPNRRSDSAVPRPSLGAHHPPLHRMNNAAHELGAPYQIKRFTTSTPNVSLLAQPSSEDNLHYAAMQHTPQSMGQTHELSTSVPTSAWTPPQIHTQSQPQSYQASPVDSFRPQMPSSDFLQPRADHSFLNNALSPGNPSRYSMNDFSQLWPAYSGGGMYSNPSYAVSADQLGTSNYSDWSMDTPQFSQSNTAVQTPQNRLSVASIDQPPLTHSPSNTVSSEAGSSIYPGDTSYPNYSTQAPSTINPSFTSKDYFGLDPVSENMGDMPNESFAYQPDATVSMDDLFGGEPGPAEPMIKPEPQEYSMNQSFASPEQYSSSNSGPSLVVPQFSTDMGTTSSYVQYNGQSTTGQEQSQHYSDPSMGGAFAWNLGQQQNSNMS